MTRLARSPDLSRGPPHVPLPVAVRRLRRQLFGASVTVAAGVCVIILCAGTLRGLPARELLVSLAGAALALSAELLCLDAALRRVARLVAAPVPRALAPRGACGVPLARA